MARQARRANQFAFRFHAYAVCPALKSKIFFFRFFVNNDLLLPFRDLHKGRIAIVTNVERNAVDAKMLETCGIATRTAKSCGPGAPMQALSWRRCFRIAPITVANAGSPGRARISRKPLRGEGRSVSACTCGFRARASFFCAGAPGAAATRPSLHPLFSEGMNDAKLGRNSSRERELVVAAFSWPVLRDGRGSRPPQDEVGTCGTSHILIGEERGKATRLEP
jgi:hypothetical protein